MFWLPSLLSDDPAERFAGLMMALISTASEHGHQRRLGALVAKICDHLRRIAARFTRALANRDKPLRIRVKTTIIPQPKPERPNTPYEHDKRPTCYGWLARLIPQTEYLGSILLEQLIDPFMADLIAQSPAIRRILRPLLNMLRTPLPRILQLPPCPPWTPPPGHIPKTRIHPFCDYQPGPRREELRAMARARGEARRKIRP